MASIVGVRLCWALCSRAHMSDRPRERGLVISYDDLYHAPGPQGVKRNDEAAMAKPMILSVTAPLSPPRSLAHELIARLTADITSGKIPPGSQLPTEQELIAATGVSRTVVREAVAALRAEGLVVTRQGVGAFVPDNARRSFRVDLDQLSSLREVLDVMELRTGIEIETAGLAAERAATGADSQDRRLPRRHRRRDQARRGRHRSGFRASLQHRGRYRQSAVPALSGASRALHHSAPDHSRRPRAAQARLRTRPSRRSTATSCRRSAAARWRRRAPPCAGICSTAASATTNWPPSLIPISSAVDNAAATVQRTYHANGRRHWRIGWDRHTAAQAASGASIRTSAGAIIAPPRDLAAHETFVKADLAVMSEVETAVDGAQGIVHLGGFSTEGPWETILQAQHRRLLQPVRGGAPPRRRACRVRVIESRDRILSAPAPHRHRRAGAAGLALRRQQGVRRGARRALCLQARPARHLDPHRQFRRRAGSTSGGCRSG